MAPSPIPDIADPGLAQDIRFFHIFLSRFPFHSNESREPQSRNQTKDDACAC
jgi:hypothetical protein